jgi:hypothetical protein
MLVLLDAAALLDGSALLEAVALEGLSLLLGGMALLLATREVLLAVTELLLACAALLLVVTVLLLAGAELLDSVPLAWLAEEDAPVDDEELPSLGTPSPVLQVCLPEHAARSMHSSAPAGIPRSLGWWFMVSLRSGLTG